MFFPNETIKNSFCWGCGKNHVTYKFFLTSFTRIIKSIILILNEHVIKLKIININNRRGFLMGLWLVYKKKYALKEHSFLWHICFVLLFIVHFSHNRFINCKTIDFGFFIHSEISFLSSYSCICMLFFNVVRKRLHDGPKSRGDNFCSMKYAREWKKIFCYYFYCFADFDAYLAKYYDVNCYVKYSRTFII